MHSRRLGLSTSEIKPILEEILQNESEVGHAHALVTDARNTRSL